MQKEVKNLLQGHLGRSNPTSPQLIFHCGKAAMSVNVSAFGRGSPATCKMPSSRKRSRYIAPSPEIGWHSFSTQAAALEFADTSSVDGAIWSLEHSSTGKRSYIVASREDFWRRYKTLPSQFRHYYELIRAGTACHLYFDLEFDRRTNADADGPRMVSTLLEELGAVLTSKLQREHGLKTGERATFDVVDLDSSTPKKFSRHLIIRLHGGFAWTDNLHCGRFVHAMCASFLPRRAGEPRIAELFVAPPAGVGTTAAVDAQPTSLTPTPPPAERVSFVDLTVYSRNRCFRLFKSSKVGKTAQLLPAGMSEEAFLFMPYAEEHRLFTSSLVSSDQPDAILLREEEVHGVAQGDGRPRVDGTSSSSASASGGVCAADGSVGAVNLPRPPTSAGGSGARSCAGACRHEALASFVLGAWSLKTGLPAHTRAWSMDAEGGRLTLSLAPSNRWCAHVQRPHRSNGTFLRVDLRQGTFAQFCYDSECRASGFRGSDALPIPTALCEAVLMEEQLGSGEQHLGAAWLSEAELAAVPLDEIVAAHISASQSSQPQAGDGLADVRSWTPTAGTVLSIEQTGPEWLTDEALRAIPLEYAPG